MCASKALESGLNLGREALDSLRVDLVEKARNMALELSERSEMQPRLALNRLRERTANAIGGTLFGKWPIAGDGDQHGCRAVRVQPPAELINRVRNGRVHSEIDGTGGNELITACWCRWFRLIWGPRHEYCN